MNINSKQIESSNSGMKTIYKLSDKQPFISSMGYSTDKYSDFFIRCATRANISVGDAKIIKQMYTDTNKIIKDSIPELLNGKKDSREIAIQKIIKISGVPKKKVNFFMDNVETIRVDVPRSRLQFDASRYDQRDWKTSWDYLKTTQVGPLYKLLLSSEWIGMIVDKSYYKSSYIQGLNYQASSLLTLCEGGTIGFSEDTMTSVEEAFVLLFWFRYNVDDSIWKNIFCSFIAKRPDKPQYWHVWTVLQIIINKFSSRFVDYSKLKDNLLKTKEQLKSPIDIQKLSGATPADIATNKPKLENKKKELEDALELTTIMSYCQDTLYFILGVDLNKDLQRMYFYTIFKYGTAGLLIFIFTLFNKILKNTTNNFIIDTVNLNNNKITINLLKQIDKETISLDSVEIYEGKKYFQKHMEKIGKLYKKKSKAEKKDCPSFDVPKKKSFLSGGKKRRRKFTKKEWVKIQKNRTLKKY